MAKMNTLQWIALVLFISTCTAELDYSPCSYNKYNNQIYCEYSNALKVLNAFRRNRGNPDIDILRLERVANMTDDILAEIVDIVASAASENVRTISLWFLENVEKIPEAISQFRKLQVFHIEYLYGIKVLPEGSMKFTSDNLNSIVCAHTNLQAIEPGAFQGNFNGTIINLGGNNIKKFDEEVFKPLLTHSTATIQITDAFSLDPLRCDCGLAWILRDHRRLLTRIIRSYCTNDKEERQSFEKVDPKTMNDC